MTVIDIEVFSFNQAKSVFMSDDDTGQNFTADLLEDKFFDDQLVNLDRQEDSSDASDDKILLEDQSEGNFCIRNYQRCKNRRTREKSSTIQTT